MDFSATVMIISVLVFLMGPIGTANSSPVCPKNCSTTKQYNQPYFKHVSDLSSSSAAPWHMNTNRSPGRLPQSIQYAVCEDCTVKHMVAQPIYLEISVFQQIRNGSNSVWCRCPYNLAVGCTCVQKQ